MFFIWADSAKQSREIPFQHFKSMGLTLLLGVNFLPRRNSFLDLRVLKQSCLFPWIFFKQTLSLSSTVQPNTPENVSAVVVHKDQIPFVRVSWEKPRTADTRSGWITLVYQIQIKPEKDEEWEVG